MIARILPPRKQSIVDRITIHFDGIVFDSPPYLAAWSFVVHLNGDPVYNESAPIDPSISSNDISTKMLGLFMALQWLAAQDRYFDHIVFMGDNLMIMASMNGTQYPPDNAKYRPLWTECRKLAAPFVNIQFVWITKRENRESRVLSLSEIQKVKTTVKTS